MPIVTACLVCQSTRLEKQFNAKGYTIARCIDCGFCMVTDPPDDAQLTELYTNLHVTHQNFRDERAAARENRSRLQFVNKHLAAGSHLLDAGCATGDFLHEALQRYRVAGMDISSDAIEVAKLRLPVMHAQLKSGRLEKTPFDDNTFDAICLWDVIEHVKEPAQVINHLLTKLKPGGYLFLSTPDVGSTVAMLMQKHWAFMTPPFHLGYFSLATMKILLEDIAKGTIVEAKTRGKWSNFAFIVYKLGQIHPLFAPTWLKQWLSTSAMGKCNLYIPTNDIMYLAMRKSERTN